MKRGTRVAEQNQDSREVGNNPESACYGSQERRIFQEQSVSSFVGNSNKIKNF